MRKKLEFPWEVPDFGSERELRDFWESHEITDTYRNFYRTTESFEIKLNQFTVKFVFVAIPVLRKWNSDGQLISSRYEDHVSQKLAELKEKLKAFASKEAKTMRKDMTIVIDFVTQKRLKEI
jgi:hypothetical protein